jgi:[ribosomal protein S5]-alanine N-acetyltransferase
VHQPQVVLRPPSAGDEAAFIRAAKASQRLHGRWVQPPADPTAYAAYLARLTSSDGCGWLVIRSDYDDSKSLRDAQPLVGVFNISCIVRGAFQSAFLGYYAFAPHAGQGLMSAGMRALLTVAFGALKLHRLEANIQPDNHASIHLVKATGFQYEGFSKRYLKIRGRWRDHERWAITVEDHRAPKAKRQHA